MKTTVTLLILLTLFSPNTFAQDYTQLGLPEGAKARLGKGTIFEIVYSPDGIRLAVASSSGIWLYDTTTHQEVVLLTGHTSPVTSITFSPDGRTLASGSEDGTIRLWDVVTGAPQRTLTGHTDWVLSVAFSPDGRTLASGSDDQTVRLWDGVTGASQRTLTGHTDWVYSVAFSPDGRTLASGSGDGTTLLWDIAPPPVEPPPPVVEAVKLAEDVNGNGIVNILDLALVGLRLGQTGENDADVNGDGVVDIADLVQVAGALGNEAAAPSAHPQALDSYGPGYPSPTAADVQGWLTQARQLDLTDATSQRGVLFLEQLLAALTPKETALLPNYPNPFNPETWIPYHLAYDADVVLTVYDAKGLLVRRLDLGHQPAGYYTARAKAAYWNSRNESGESVASGVYFYQLRAGDYTTVRRMVIVK